MCRGSGPRKADRRPEPTGGKSALDRRSPGSTPARNSVTLHVADADNGNSYTRAGSDSGWHGVSTERATLQLYALEDDRWVLEEHYTPDKHAQAIEAAKRLATQPGVKAARVVRETYDEDRGLYKEFTVFDTRGSRTS